MCIFSSPSCIRRSSYKSHTFPGSARQEVCAVRCYPLQSVSTWYRMHSKSFHTDLFSAVDFRMDPVAHGTMIPTVVARSYTDLCGGKKMAPPHPDCSSDMLIVPRRPGKKTVRLSNRTLHCCPVDHPSVVSSHTGHAAVLGSTPASACTGRNRP